MKKLLQKPSVFTSVHHLPFLVYGKCSIYALRSGEHDLQENDVRIKFGTFLHLWSVNRMIFWRFIDNPWFESFFRPYSKMWTLDQTENDPHICRSQPWKQCIFFWTCLIVVHHQSVTSLTPASLHYILWNQNCNLRQQILISCTSKCNQLSWNYF